MSHESPLDLLGVGIGPFNLSLAALADGVEDLDVRCVDERSSFGWHPGMLLEGTTLQVPFLADLVTLVDPTSRWSFLAYLRERRRLFPFYFAERFLVPRAEFDDYCRWAAEGLDACRFGHRVEAIRWDEAAGAFAASLIGPDGAGEVLARNVVLGIGTAPTLPAPLRALDGPVLHSAEYLHRRDALRALDDVTVVGSGQSGAEVFLDLLRAQRPGQVRRWCTRSRAIAPMEYSKLGLEQFTPDYTRYFHGLQEPVRDRVLPQQSQLYKAISADTIAEIQQVLYERTIGGGWPDGVSITPNVSVVSAEATADGGVTLELREPDQGQAATLRTDAVVAATGYAPREPRCLRPLEDVLERDARGRLAIDAEHRLVTRPGLGGIFVQNAELHTHGVGAPDLGLGAWRSATILNAVAGREVHPLPERTAFTTFGLEHAA